MSNVIFLHGFCERLEMWDGVISGLTESQDTCYAVDLPGFGENEVTADSMAGMAHFVFRFMDEHQIPSAVIIGHSMGGYVALEMVSQFPDRINGIGLIHAHAGSDTDEKIQNRKKLIDFVLQHGTDIFLKAFSKQLVSTSNTNKTISDQAFELVKRTQHEAVIAASTAMMHRRDHRATVGTITQPMLWIIGKQDTFAPFAQIIQQSDTCKQAMVEVMDDVGHLCMYEDLAQTVHIVQRFLQWINQVSAGAETQ